MIMKIQFFATSIGILLLIQSCKKQVPLSIETLPVTNIDVATAMSGGNIISDGGSPIIDCGICWSESENVTLNTAISKTSDGQGVGWFPLEIIKLLPDTKYYVRAYALNSADTSYGNPLEFTTLDGILDIDSNGYQTVTIGTQIWLSKNLATSKYNDGNDIPFVDDYILFSQLQTPAFGWIENLEDSKNPYGAVYNWYTVGTGKLCPTGWHVPTNNDWNTLVTFLGGTSIAGGKLKEKGIKNWSKPNTGATDDFGFTALPTGRGIYDYYNRSKEAHWWSASSMSGDGYCWHVLYNESSLFRTWGQNNLGLTVRCVKDQ